MFVYFTKGRPCHKNIFDSHCHYDDHAFDEDRYEVLDRLLCDPDSPVDKVCHAATDERSSLFGIETAKNMRISIPLWAFTLSVWILFLKIICRCLTSFI